MTDRPRVIVAGAGPAGVVAALRLARAGIDVRVLEASHDVAEGMRASTFHPPTLDMLATLGLAKDLIATGLKVRRWQMRQHDSGTFVNFDLARIADCTDHPFRLQTEQHRLCHIGIDALADAGVNIEFDSAVASVAQDDTGIEVRLRDGDTAIRGDWLIGADGASSAVRGALGIGFSGKSGEQSSVLAYTPFPFHRKIEDLESIAYCWSHRGPFSLLRLKQGWRLGLYAEEHDVDAGSAEALVRDWLEYIHADAGKAELDAIALYRSGERCAETFRRGRACLIGDAAHIHPTVGGMGMNGGIHDAMNLAEKLLGIIGGGSDELLDRYTRQRRHVAENMVLPRAAANKERLAARDPDAQVRRLTRYRAIADDETRCREFLLASSMIASLEEAARIR